MSEKKALTKFLRSVEWSDVQVSTYYFIFYCYINSTIPCAPLKKEGTSLFCSINRKQNKQLT